MSKLQKVSERQRAAEMMALEPNLGVKEIATKLNVNHQTILRWRRDPNFVDMVYQIYMVEFGAEIPGVLKAMIREAKAGNVQAGRLVLEHSGKLVKNINVTIDSPFEKYLKADKEEIVYQDAEITEIVDDIPEIEVELPKRKVENQEQRARTEYATIRKTAQNSKRRMGRNKMYKWKQRAKKAGVPLLSGGRPTKATKEEWIKKIMAKEKEIRHEKRNKRA